MSTQSLRRKTSLMIRGKEKCGRHNQFLGSERVVHCQIFLLGEVFPKQECALLDICENIIYMWHKFNGKVLAHGESLAQIGLRTGKNVTKHLLAKNSWESNLVADISKVDHLEGDQGKGLFLKSPDNLRARKAVVVCMQDRGFNGFASNIIKRQVNETKLSCLLARTRALILYISISIFDFGPEKLPGISRNGPQDTTATLGRAPSILRRLLRLRPSSKRRGYVGRKSLALQLGWKRRHTTNSVTHFQPCKRNTWKHLQKHQAVVPHSSKYSGRSNHWHYIDYQNKQQSKKTRADPVPRKKRFSTILLRRSISQTWRWKNCNRLFQHWKVCWRKGVTPSSK